MNLTSPSGLASPQEQSSHEGGDNQNPFDDGLQDLNLPVPVQTFLWRQIAPFIRPKLGKLHEASCTVRIDSFSLLCDTCII